MANKILTEPVTWKRFLSDDIEIYSGQEGEPIIDARDSDNWKLRVCDGVTPGCHLVAVGVTSGVAIPKIVSPLDGSGDVVLSPIITGSHFAGIKEDGTADTHVASTWVFYSDAARTDVLWNSGRDTVNLTSIDLDGRYEFSHNVPVYAEVVYEGESGNVQNSELISFTPKVSMPETFLTKLFASNGGADDRFGREVSLSSDGLTAAVMAVDDSAGYGLVYIFSKASGSWQETDTLSISGGNRSFSSIALSGDGKSLAVGISQDDTLGVLAGAVHIFSKVSGSWLQGEKLIGVNYPNNATDQLGISVSISDDGLVVVAGAIQSDIAVTSGGAAYVFSKASGSWVDEATLTASDAAVSDKFGDKVSLSDDGIKVVIAARANSDAGSNSGAAYVFSKASGSWIEEEKLLSSDIEAADSFGESVFISGDGQTVIVGADNWDYSGVIRNSGAAYIFQFISGSWQEIEILSPEVSKDNGAFGRDVCLSSDGSIALVGTNGNYLEPAFYLFSNVSGSWAQINRIADGSSNTDFACSLALSADGSTALVGAREDNTLANNAGSAYIYS